MRIKNFLFSYKNILKKEIERKRYFSFLRKTVNLFLKYFLNTLKKYFSKKLNNLDNVDNEYLFKKNLDFLFVHFNTDKGKSFKIESNKVINSHNYSLFYEKYLQKFKEKNLNFLEIGSHEGKGLASFYYYFPFAKFVGANINPFQMRYFSERIEEIFIDVSSKRILKNFASYYNDRSFDVIIDDASHNLKDIIQTLPILFKKVKNNGFYVIEDINQFDAFPNLNPNNDKLTPIKMLEKIKKDENFNSPYIDRNEIDYLKTNVKNIYFEKGNMILNGHHVSDIVFIEKKDI